MKCQKCNNPATFHITEMTDDEPVELHFCEMHANQYLHKGSLQYMESPVEEGSGNSSVLQDTTQELMELDFQTCPICGIGFQEFRKSGRLGCPNDYQCFGEQLEPLLIGIHGASEHIGKRPSQDGSQDRRLLLIRLRRELDDAVLTEDYEHASHLRDQIRDLEVEKI
ncbi:MAG: UvrB/UvrC motif-containing protein [Planctomycetia bacterium]|nr:UvrB/UvrC motif-containing protein [Planctomycetia bacterium]